MPTRPARTSAHTPARIIAALVVVAGPVALAPAAHAATPAAPATTAPGWVVPTPIAYTTTAIELKVTVGPAGATITCNLDGDLRVPVTATPAHPAPAIVITNGFGDTKSTTGQLGNASFAEQYAGQGYVTVSYSGLGFGDSTCPIELDSPAYDGEAASDLISFLGGDLADAYYDYTPEPGGNPTGDTPGTWSDPVTTAPPVELDHCDHSVPQRCGAADPYDPRVGMVGGSYAGEVQFAVASVDPRIDTIIPVITWNDLAYSLAPNNQGAAGDDLDGPGTAPVTQDATSPGVAKTEWLNLLFADGLGQPILNPPASGATSATCPGYNPSVCDAYVDANGPGYPSAADVAYLRSVSVDSYISKIHIPVFLSQGEDDTLFDLREAIATYEELKAQGTPVKMMWQFWGHSGSPLAGEIDATTPVPELYDDLRYSAWMARYLRGDTSALVGPAFEYLAPWEPNDGTASTPDAAQYLGATGYPVGSPTTYYLSGSGNLVSSASQVAAGDATFSVSDDTATSFTEVSGVNQTEPVTDTPGTFAAFSTAPLGSDEYQVGSPTLTVDLSAPTFAATEAAGGAGQLVLFAKLYDVAPDGTITLTNRVISPVRITDVDQPVTIHLPAEVHEFPAGDTMELVLANGDGAYKGNDTAGTVSVVNDPSSPNTLSVPMTDGTGMPSDLTGVATPPAATPEVGLPAALALAGGGVGVAVLQRRRRRAAGASPRRNL